MIIQKKPDYLIFADSAKKGENIDFPDVSRGWGITIDQTASKPPMEWMNGAFNRIDKNMIYLLQQGVPEWSEKVIYPVNAIIKYNGVLYTAIVENDNAIPTTSNKWKKTIAEAPNASTTQKGIVKLSSDTNSTSETEAATPNAVKKACDLASGAVKKSGDTMTGQLILSEFGIKHRYTDSENLMVLRTIGDNYSCMFYDAEKKQWQSKLVYSSSTNSWNFPSIDDVKINNKSVLTIRSYGIGVSHVLGDESIDETKNQYSGFLFTQQQSKGEKPFNYSHVMRSAVSDSFADIAIDILSRRAKFRGVLTDKKNAAYTGDYSWTELLTTQNISNYIPVGVPLPWPTNQPPAGWLECNGSTFDKNKFPKLAVVYPTGKLPDLRGVFIRGKDNLRGLDPYRDILSYQDDAIRNIKGGLPTGNFKALLGHAKIAAGDKNGAILTQSAGDDYIASSASSTNPRQLRWMFFDFDASRVVPTANENRPRNVAFNYIVKAE